MTLTKPFLAALLLIPLLVFAAPEEEDIGAQIRALDWHIGPAAESIAGKATLNTPDDNHLFIDEINSRKFLELSGNLPEDGNFILLNTENGWWATFSFDPIGYVKDDEKIDANALLSDMKANDDPANQERKRLGLASLHTIGWHTPPHYDPQTRRLEWGLKLRSDDEAGETVNYTIRLLGRTGVVNATLISSPENLDQDIQSFKTTLTGFDFNSGERYSEFKQGDRIAEYGLAALIAGGAVAVATKKGWWAAIGGFLAAAWKFVAAGAIALFAGIRAWFSKRKKS